MAQNWLGISLDFNKVEEKTSENTGNSLLKEGKYRATIKSATKTTSKKSKKPVLALELTLDDYNKEINHNLFLPESIDTESDFKFKSEILRNFLTRFAFRQLTKDEYLKLDTDTVVAELQKLQTQQPNFTGAKTLVDIKQEPFISRDRNTKAINYTNVTFDAKKCPQDILKLIQAEQKKGIEFNTFPVILFSNKIATFGFGFYNDYNPELELKNSPSYEFAQAINKNTGNSGNDVIDLEEIPF